MLLDEVTSALDPELVGEVLAAVRDLKAEGVTMIIATHEMGFAREVADTVGFLHEGRLIEVGAARAGARGPERARDAALPPPPAGGAGVGLKARRQTAPGYSAAKTVGEALDQAAQRGSVLGGLDLAPRRAGRRSGP